MSDEWTPLRRTKRVTFAFFGVIFSAIALWPVALGRTDAVAVAVIVSMTVQCLGCCLVVWVFRPLSPP
jgi:hypothetical protein